MWSWFKRVPPQKDMPLFTDKKESLLMIEKIQNLLEELKSEINKSECPKCRADLVEEKGSGDVYYRRSYKNDQNSREAWKKQAEKTSKDKQGGRSCETKFSSEKNTKEYIEQLKEEKASLNSLCLMLKEENENNIAIIADLKKTLSENVNEIAIFKEKITKYREDERKQRDIIVEKDDRINILSNTTKDIEEEKAKFEEIINCKEEEEKCRNTELERLRKLIDEYAASDKEKESKIQKLNRNMEDMNYKLEKQQRENSELRKLNHQHKSSLDVKEKELCLIKERCKELEVQIEMNSRKEISVGFHTTLAPAMSSLILDGLMKELSDRLAVEKVDLSRRPFYGNTDFNCPLLAICVNVSRIGTDAKEVLKGIPKASNSKDVALLVFHHKEAHALPSQSSDKILTGTDFNHLGTIIDFAFLSQRGIYECDMNMMGIERIASFLLQYKTKKNQVSN